MTWSPLLWNFALGARVLAVEDREMAPGGARIVRVLADREQEVVAHGVDVAREPVDLELADDARPGGVTEIEREQRIGLTERDEVAFVPDHPARIDSLALRQPLQRTDRAELAAGRPHHEQVVATLLAVPRPVGGGDPEIAVVLAHRELVEELALDPAARDVARPRLLRPERELVDLGAVARRPLDVPGVVRRRDVHRVGRRVDRAAADHCSDEVDRAGGQRDLRERRHAHLVGRARQVEVLACELAGRAVRAHARQRGGDIGVGDVGEQCPAHRRGESRLDLPRTQRLLIRAREAGDRLLRDRVQARGQLRLVVLHHVQVIADDARAGRPALDIEHPLDPRRLAVRDIDDHHARAALVPAVECIGRRALDDHLVAAEVQLLRVQRLERDACDDIGLRDRPRLRDHELIVVDRVDELAVGLHDVGLVDAALVHVRRRVVRRTAVPRRATRRRRGLGRGQVGLEAAAAVAVVRVAVADERLVDERVHHQLLQAIARLRAGHHERARRRGLLGPDGGGQQRGGDSGCESEG